MVASCEGATSASRAFSVGNLAWKSLAMKEFGELDAGRLSRDRSAVGVGRPLRTALTGWGR
jgi:hypothetical protein